MLDGDAQRVEEDEYDDAPVEALSLDQATYEEAQTPLLAAEFVQTAVLLLRIGRRAVGATRATRTTRAERRVHVDVVVVLLAVLLHARLHFLHRIVAPCYC